MKHFSTSVVELRQDFASAIETHPFECGWAEEAIFFVEVHDASPGTTITLRVQLSPDGIRWLDEGTTLAVADSAFVRVTQFGGFLRLVGIATTEDGRETPCVLSVRLALKG
ncbi:hypothetical protein [Agromyces aerolatus]|uniref:hypothetical protein n=1 Tax=Agromyces sp. LY-1074 TaxID=3074080 RepID=UPI0028622908|nr:MULTISPECIES: hypothetical protein [unclassified Agromyces]MDR5699256.1 hypothetical protein [Agromyces sp. LY-1074]MDR5705552.1 hypothetical protein [Agromyces sp. LY-1358]